MRPRGVSKPCTKRLGCRTLPGSRRRGLWFEVEKSNLLRPTASKEITCPRARRGGGGWSVFLEEVKYEEMLAEHFPERMKSKHHQMQEAR